jgi:RNA polymerase sigma factor (sigma-70 family)
MEERIRERMPPLATTITLPTLDEVVRSARAGEATAIGALYDRYAVAVFRTAYRISGSAADAEDIVHDIFVGLPEALKRYEERGNLGAWLTRVTVRYALMRARSDRRRGLLPLEDAVALASAERTDLRVEVSELQHGVMSLPDGLRIVFMLKQVEGYSHHEIGAMLGISAGASRVRLSRALEVLRRSLG